MCRDGENYTMLLHYVNCQSAAAAQATAVACGAYHTSALLIKRDSGGTDSSKVTRHNLFMFGRGFHGQLGNNSYDSQKAPSVISLGYKPCSVSYGAEGMPGFDQ
jgi:E3 ubiquitin-protein ligase HERC3